MSKLSDAIRRATRVETAPIGFAPVATRKRRTMLLIAQVAGGSAPEGADVLLARPQDLPAAADNGADEGPLRGALLDETAVAAPPSGFDFLVFDGDAAPAAILLNETQGLVMTPPPDLSDSLLQALQWLPLDALLVRWQGSVTVRRLLELQRLSGFSRKPLLLVLHDEPQAAELEALREAGVVGVVVDISAPGGTERFARLRETIDNLRPRPRRTRTEGIVSTQVSLIPVSAPLTEEPDEPDEDE